MKNGIQLALFFLFMGALGAQSEIEFQEGPWETIPCQDCENAEDQIVRKQFGFWCGETLVGNWSLTKLVPTNEKGGASYRASKQGNANGGSVFQSDTLAMLDVFRQVRQICPQGRDLKRRPTEHIDYALFIIQHFFDPFPEPSKPEVSEPAVRSADEMPRFPGCENMGGSLRDKKSCADKEMLEFVYRNQYYPAEARSLGIQGTGVISLIIEKDGMVSEPKIVRDIGGGCGEEALRIVRLMQDQAIRWAPGRQNGRPVRCVINLPVKFMLTR